MPDRKSLQSVQSHRFCFRAFSSFSVFAQYFAEYKVLFLSRLYNLILAIAPYGRENRVRVIIPISQLGKLRFRQVVGIA